MTLKFLTARASVVALAVLGTSMIGQIAMTPAYADGVSIGPACVSTQSGGIDGTNITGTQTCTTPASVGN